MANSTLVLALTGGGGSAPAPAPKPPDKSGLKEWMKKHLQALGRAPANLAGKSAHWLICLLVLEYIGKYCDLARRKPVGLGHCCGDPASRGCSGLASETITKAPQGHSHPNSHKGRFLFFVGRRALSFLR